MAGMMQRSGKTRLLGFMTIIITVAILLACLWPFDFSPVNKVEWLQQGPGIRFYGRGMVFSPDRLVLRDAFSEDRSVTVELLVRSSRESSTHVASFLTLYDRDRERFMLGQWKKELIVRVPAPNASRGRMYREIGVGNALIRNRTLLVTIASGREATDVYVDGRLEKSFPRFSLLSEVQGVVSGQLVLGNSPEGTHPWRGAFYGLAVYDRVVSSSEALEHYRAWKLGEQPEPPASAWPERRQDDDARSKRESAVAKRVVRAGSDDSRKAPRSLGSGGADMQGPALQALGPLALYLFDEHDGDRIRDHSGNERHLLVPMTFQPLRREVLRVPSEDQFVSRSNLLDIISNIFGFAPFGLFLAAWLRRRRSFSAPLVFVLVVLSGFCLSLAIELIQAYLPPRASSITDLASNTLGTAIGALVLSYVLPVLQFGKDRREV
jgi:VanZ family protein